MQLPSVYGNNSFLPAPYVATQYIQLYVMAILTSENNASQLSGALF